MQIKVHYVNRCMKRHASLGVIAAAMLALCGPAQALTQSDESISGVTNISAQWQSYDLHFHYFGFSTYYSCTGLEDRLKQLLLDLGADRDVSVSASGCFGFNDIGKSLSAHIKVRMPAALETSEQSSFPAASRTVKLPAGRAGESGSGDCELLEQVRNQLLPALKLQVIKDSLNCVPGQAMVGGRGLQVMALIPEKKQR